MDTLEGLDDGLFNVLPIVTCSFLHYFICVIGVNNRMEELFHLLLIRRVCFLGGVTESRYPLVTDTSCTSLYLQIHSQQFN